MGTCPDWAQLPSELVESISKKLTVYSDYLRFRCVCHSWQSSTPKNPTHLPPQLPWLMLPQSQPSQSHRAFFNLSTCRAHFLHLPLISSSLRKRRRGSSLGWLLILDATPSLLLLNPLTRVTSPLPPLSSFPNILSFEYSNVGREYLLTSPLSGELYTRSLAEMRDSFVKKLVLTSSPGDDKGGFIAVVIVNQTGDLAYCKGGDFRWRFIDNARCYSEDVVYFDGLFYAVDNHGVVAECDVGEEVPVVRIIEAPRLEDADMRYLVKAGEDLLLVSRYLDVDHDIGNGGEGNVNYRTVGFDVFRMNWRWTRWEKVENLGDRMLFIGENSSFSLLASDFTGCVGNCIYFTDDYSEFNYESGVGGYDSGIFRLCDGTIQELPPYPRNSDYQVHWRPGSLPLWVTPNPC